MSGGRTVAIIQARVGSRRLPGKVLADVAGAPLLSRMIERVRHAQLLDQIVVATSDGPADAPVRELAKLLEVGCFAGSEEDVLGRFAGAAVRFGADPVVRLTADCPLIDPTLIDRCIVAFLAGHCDYLALGGPFPDGLDTEVLSAAALARADAEATLSSDREHVTPYVWRQPERFRCSAVTFPVALAWRRWTVDEPRDLAFVRAVYASLHRPGECFGWEEVEGLLAREPALAVLNAGIERNAGYRRSLLRDASAGGPT